MAQHKIVWELTKDKQRVCVVGDDAQSIYSFRGANIENILGFTKQYNCAKVFKLEQNGNTVRIDPSQLFRISAVELKK